MKSTFHLVLLGIAAMMAAGCVASRPAPARTVAERLQEYGPAARTRLRPYLKRAGLNYPPQKVAFVGLKTERELQVYAENDNGGWRFVRAYPLLGASGVVGPKLREGDRQVPEGIYTIDLLNPNSRHQISMQLGYPNAFDRNQAAREGRTNLGGEIMIHGGDTSIGCLAVGDESSAELFVLTADTGISNVTVILSPVDFRSGRNLLETNELPAWTSDLYEQIKVRLTALPQPDNP